MMLAIIAENAEESSGSFLYNRRHPTALKCLPRHIPGNGLLIEM
jgi:hypothetical protein